MPPEKDNILEFNQYNKSGKIPYIIQADIESLIQKIDGCANNLENSSTMGEQIPCGHLIPTIWVFDHMQNKDTLYHGKDYMKRFWNL